MNIRELLKAGLVKFSYTKKSGEERVAIGTLNPLLIPKYADKNIEKLMEDAGFLVSASSQILSGEVEATRGEYDWNDFQEIIKDTTNSISTLRGENKRKGKPLPESVVLYYDLKAKGFRRFDIGSLGDKFEFISLLSDKLL